MRKTTTWIISISMLLFLSNCDVQSPLEIYRCKIINADSYKPHKKNIYIEVQEQITEDQIKEIAKFIKKGNPEYDRLFIFYLLPNSDPGSAAWATSHYNPTLEIDILGITKDEKKKLEQQNEPVENVIGKWFCSITGFEHNIMFVKDNDSLFAIMQFPNGSKIKEILQEKANKRFDIVGNKHGEFYVLKKSGDLELWDPEGKFATAKRIE